MTLIVFFRRAWVILALSTAFWDAYLKGDAFARAWLDGNGPRSVMEGRDEWHVK